MKAHLKSPIANRQFETPVEDCRNPNWKLEIGNWKFLS
jgi:hypothetical protein